ncbi:DUF397 domain-containing protein [Streptomyces sp. NPDC003077]|uniref:DUF397 domain-containing protein n=1 Tax=Streptomyces sp. NPDC003077 TaxID=3154443 RepID=UPI0033B966D8
MRIPELDGVIWHKSTHSGGGSSGGDCVEVAVLPESAAVRDSKDPDGPVLLFPVREWRAFVRRVRVDRRV